MIAVLIPVIVAVVVVVSRAVIIIYEVYLESS